MFRVGWVSVAIASAWPLAAAAEPLPIEALLQPAALRGAQLSPSGRHLAMIAAGKDGDAVVVTDLFTSVRATVLPARAGADLSWLRWKGEGRLLVGVPARAGLTALDAPVGESVLSIPRDGGEPLELVGPRPVSGAAEDVRLSDPMASDPRHVMIVAPGRRGGPSLWKVNVHNGAARYVREGEGDDDGLPGGAMVVRYDHKAAGDRAPAGDPGMVVLGPAGAERVYAAVAPRTPADGDTTTVRIFDYKTGAMSAPVWPALRYDVQDIVYRAPGEELAGVCYVADAYACAFKDAQLQSDYGRIRRGLGADRSVTPLSMSDGGRWWLLGVSGPREPGTYYLFDRRAKSLRRVADRFPGLAADRLARMEPFAFTTRDGVRAPGYVTVPPDAPEGPLPLVVMPHGGPEVRDALGYDRWAQALATRGYLVFQPNFRGSSGYGRAWTEAGYREWGGRMQDDLTDGVAALIAAGKADPRRVCIVGASYGGYAALYGGGVQPDLYRCVVSVAGVADLPALLAHERTTKGEESGEYQYARAAIGDPETEAAKLARTSPIAYAAAYRPPVLLLHGERDRSVPLAQSQAMEQALKAAGRDVRLMVMPGEGHADWAPEREAEALTAITDFLKANLGGAVRPDRHDGAASGP